MDVFNKLRSTVSSTVSTLSGVLPGNPVTREFEVTNHVCSAGPGLLWKVYHGYKKSTKQEASIFVFEKKILERWPRESRDNILDSLKRGVSQLTRLRHPQVLTVQHPLEESRDSLAFATEPVFASLSNVLGNHENMPVTPTQAFKDYKLYDIETKYGLLQLGEGLAFLHNDVKLLHNNICPESIIINHEGAWKIFGFDFCIHNVSKPDLEPSWSYTEHSTCLPQVCQPNLDYLAPEAALANTRTPSADMFALGVVIYAIHNNGAPIVSFYNEFSSYKNRIGELKSLNSSKLSKVPQGLQEMTKMLLNFTCHLRPDAHQFRKIDYFEDVGVKTLNYLDSLFQWDKLQKSQFYKGLPQIIQNFPHRVCLHRVVPCLGKEFANPTMIPFVLPVVLQIAENSSRAEYMSHIFQYLRAAMKITEPVQILLIFMQKMELLLKLTPAEEVKTDVLPMLYRALDSDAQQIQELCLSVLPTYSSLIDFPAMKNALLPRIKRLAVKTVYLSVRVNCLVCIGKLLENLDKWLVLDDVLPFLQEIPSREPAVIMAILGIYKVTLNHKKLGIPKEVIANTVIPFLMPLSIENGLTLTQFNSLIAVLKEMVNRVESEHRIKLEQLNAISQETAALNTNVTTADRKTVGPVVSSDLESIFSTLQVSLNSDSGLSLEEKQRIVRQQETSQKFKLQNTPIAPEKAQKKSAPQAKDLTSTLLENNLAQISRNSGNWTKSMISPTSQQSSHLFNAQPNQQVSIEAAANFTSPYAQHSVMWRPPTFANNPSFTNNGMLGNSLPFNPPAQFAQPNLNSHQAALGNYVIDNSLQQQKAKPLSSSEIKDLLM